MASREEKAVISGWRGNSGISIKRHGVS